MTQEDRTNRDQSVSGGVSDKRSDRMMRLDDVLKRSGLVGSGGQAKILIQDGLVEVNGVVETRRRKQLFLGDNVEFMGQTVELDESFFDS
ncbi:MAG: RNA-binding S4 domain-containing protein [Planctomycetota bacterium]